MPKKPAATRKPSHGFSTSRDVAAFRTTSHAVAGKALASSKAARTFLKRLDKIETTFSGHKK
jgi:hypothetical protein